MERGQDEWGGSQPSSGDRIRPLPRLQLLWASSFPLQKVTWQETLAKMRKAEEEQNPLSCVGMGVPW